MEHEDRLVSYYMNETNKRLDRIEEKIELLVEYRAMLLGRTKIVATLVAAVTSMLVGGIEWFLRK